MGFHSCGSHEAPLEGLRLGSGSTEFQDFGFLV